MYTKLHKPSGKPKNGISKGFNISSCVKLVDYLSKELSEDNKFFSHTKNDVLPMDVVNNIDKNIMTLKKKQEKFYMLSYNPSQREIKHLIYNVTDKRVNSLNELTNDEKKKVYDEFREYIRQCMNIYAASFNRAKTLTGDDLVYYAKIEEERKYTNEDKEVIEGTAKKGSLKPGINLHCHVIVSRMDKSQKISLSPFAKARNAIGKLNGKDIKVGFNMKLWQMQSAQKFNEMYNYINSSDELFWVGDSSLFPYYTKKKVRHQILTLPKNKILAQEIKFIRDFQNADSLASFLLLGIIKHNNIEQI